MTNLQIEYFLSVVQTKSITRTASELYVSPPAVSKQISLLEEELGVVLFNRGSRGMELTPGGELIYNHLYSQKTAFGYVLQHARSMENFDTREIHVGVLARWPIYQKLHEIENVFSETPNPPQIKFHSCFNPGGSSILERGELDAAICLANDVLIYSQTHELDFKEIARIPKIFLYSRDCSVASLPNPKPADFNDIPMLVISSKSAIDAHQNNMNLCHDLGLQPNIIFKDTLEDALLGVSMNEGFFICDSWLDPVLLPDLRHVILPDYHSVVIAWWKHNQNPYLHKLIEVCSHSINWPDELE